MFRTLALFIPLTLAYLPSCWAQTPVYLLNTNDMPAQLSKEDIAFIQSRMDSFDLSQCRQQSLKAPPRVDFRYLQVDHKGKTLKLYARPDVIRSAEVVITDSSQEPLIEFTHCNLRTILPVLSIMATAEIPDEPNSNLTRQAILSEHSFLTSHEPSYLMLRNDDIDSNASYFDFKVSLKHPVLPQAAPINALHNSLADAVEHFIPGKQEYFLQLYLSFSGRFSQYIGSRNSSPVVARSFNPAIFYRFWTSEENYLDFEFGHESNGQRISTLDGLQREENDIVANMEPAFYARDSLSRGWDYTAINWHRTWNEKLEMQLQLKHFMDDGPLQGLAEEYNLWEDDGLRQRPRNQYDGVTMEFSYNFNRSRCFLGSLPICFQKLELTHQTGTSSPFSQNTTAIEFTSNFFGLPIQLWGKTGYNNNLVDYYRYSSSWGLGIELISR